MTQKHEQSSVAVCHVCGGAVKPVAGYEKLVRVTSDCKPWRAGGKLFECAECGCVIKIPDDEWLSETETIYDQYTIYHQADGAEQAVFDQASGAACARSAKLLNCISNKIEFNSSGRLLDIGCGNGALLSAFSSIFPSWCLAGSELHDRYRSVVEAIPGVEKLFTCDISRIDGEYDAISMCHVLEHIVAPQDFLARIRNLLLPGGLLIIQIPDFITNPFDLLIADHAAHYSDKPLAALLEKCGFKIELIENGIAPKELTAVARKVENENAAKTVSKEIGFSISPAESVAWLHEVIGQARTAPGKGFGVFGTSIAGAWMYGELRDAIDYFADEDTNRTGGEFMGRKIIHPLDAPADSSLYIALPTFIAEKVAARLEAAGMKAKAVIPPLLP